MLAFPDYHMTVAETGFDPTADGGVFALLASDPYVEVAYVPTRYRQQLAIASQAFNHQGEVVVKEGGKTTHLPLEVSRVPMMPSPKLIADRIKSRKPAPVNKENK